MKAARQRNKWEVIQAIPFLNLDPNAHLVGHSNEACIIIDRQRVITLIKSGAQVSSVSSVFCKQIALKVLPLDMLLKLQGTGRATILYLAYVEVNLEIPGIRGYNKDMVLLVILTKTYAQRCWSWWGQNY